MENDSILDCFQQRLLAWWKKNKRDFPWRRTKDAYAILIAEILLRKTTAGQVERVYEDFLRRYPNPQLLASADTTEICNLLSPLGMHNTRAQLLKKLGSVLESDFGGKVPSEKKDLIRLPGVGVYAANAVLSFSYSKDEPLLDTNVVRVIERVFGVKSKKRRPHTDEGLLDFVRTILPKGRSAKFNWAILDFGAVVCTARRPKCMACPMSSFCVYFRAHNPT
ncbi:A/G-specific adenine glycosylase [Coprothermobacter proteolyticus]|uniref:A/G-specific adenine glycosylase n=1 Tax=Coprothermobacter proteolyticus TaxID=35786 RepID=UPI000D321A8F